MHLRRSLLSIAAAAALLGNAACAALRPSTPTWVLDVKHAFLWHATAPGRADLYLLGSLHAAPQPIVLGAGIETLWRATQRLVLEIDIDAVKPGEVAEVLKRRGHLAQGQLLSQVVDPATWKALTDFAKVHGFDPALLEGDKPWLAARSVEELQLGAAGLFPTFGVETLLQERAEAEHRPIEALETFDAQLAAFDAMPLPIQEQNLRKVLQPEAAQSMRAFAEIWHSGDVGLLEQVLFTDQDPDVTLFYASILYARNARMAERLDALANDGVPRFVAVGAGHLVGDHSVCAQLEQRGWTVTRVSAAPPA